jgi:V-type H+-transporting ATPase subunit a
MVWNWHHGTCTVQHCHHSYGCGDSYGVVTVHSLQDFRSCTLNNESTVFTTGLILDKENFNSIYPFGVDPIWHGTRTELTFLNSVKMKMSIVMGVVHMTLGIVMSLFNQLYFRDRLSLLFEFIPQMIFLWSLFGYLSFLIIFKWIGAQHLAARFWTCCTKHNSCNSSNSGCPSATPDLYNVMIQMVLNPGVVEDNQMYDGQAFIQVVLVLLAAVAVPTMLLPKPLILKQRHKQRTIVRSQPPAA